MTEDNDKTLFQPAKKKATLQYEVGDVLSDIYRITRFIGRGGMGEVYEAVNVHHAEERVAIKVMLPQFASDERVIEMFAKEAGTLTRLHHEAIVPYRLASRDQTGRPFIVTAYVDGPSLEDRFKDFKPTDEEFFDLTRNLAKGLGKAHLLGAIHRDIAPDNVLLVNGDPAFPKIIDFGIAKDARSDQDGATIIGDGFAGKLKYVAPEQLGEYGRKIGPWTDVYSLALTLLAVAGQRHADMGGSIVDAVKKRFSVPDISAIPSQYQQAFTAALQPDPANRPQTMADFIHLLDTETTPTHIDSFAPLEPEIDLPEPETTPVGVVHQGGKKKGLVYGGAAIGVLAVISLIYIALPKSPDVTLPVSPAVNPQSAIALSPEQLDDLGRAANIASDCAWVSYDGSDAASNSIQFVGSTGNFGAVKREISDFVGRETSANIDVDLRQVVEIVPSLCQAVDALKVIKNPTPLISSLNPSHIFEAQNQIIRLKNSPDLPVGKYAVPVIRVTDIDWQKPILLLAIDAQGRMQSFANGRAEVESLVLNLGGSLNERGFVMSLPTELESRQKDGAGLVILTGDDDFSTDLFGDTSKQESVNLNDDWGQAFLKAARAGNWVSDIYWYTIVDEIEG